jgi:hypothetical protein
MSVPVFAATPKVPKTPSSFCVIHALRTSGSILVRSSVEEACERAAVSGPRDAHSGAGTMFASGYAPAGIVADASKAGMGRAASAEAFASAEWKDEVSTWYVR